MPPPQEPIPIPLFANTQLALLADEHAADVSSSALASTAASVSPATRRTLQATGYALTGLLLSQCRTGMGGRLVGEFVGDPAMAGSSKSRDKDEAGGGGQEGRLGAHGIRVGDVVRVNDISGGKKGAKDKDKKDSGAGAAKALEGVVTRVGEKGVWIAFGQRGGNAGARSKEDDEAVEELWGKKLWLYDFSGIVDGG